MLRYTTSPKSVQDLEFLLFKHKTLSRASSHVSHVSSVLFPALPYSYDVALKVSTLKLSDGLFESPGLVDPVLWFFSYARQRHQW